MEVSLTSGVSFISSSDVRAIIESTDADPELTDALVENYEESQLEALRAALAVSAIIVVFAMFMSRSLPTRRVDEIAADVAKGEGTVVAPLEDTS